MSKYLTNQLRVDTPENRCDLIAGEVAGEFLYGLNVVEDPDALADVSHLDVVLDLGVRDPAGGVLHHDDTVLAPHQYLEHSLIIADCLVLPWLSDDLGRDAGETRDEEAVLKLLILVKVIKLSINGGLALNHPIESAMVLFEGHHSILQHPSGLAVLDGHSLWGGLKHADQLKGGVEQMQDILKSRVSREMHSICLKIWSSEARQDVQIGGMISEGL